MAAKPSPENQWPDGARQALAQRFPALHVVYDSSGLLPSPGVDEVAVVLGQAGDTGEFTIALLAPDNPGISDGLSTGTLVHRERKCAVPLRPPIALAGC